METTPSSCLLFVEYDIIVRRSVKTHLWFCLFVCLFLCNFFKLADLYPNWHQQAYNVFVNRQDNTSLVYLSSTFQASRLPYVNYLCRKVYIFGNGSLMKFTQLDEGVKLAKNFLFSIFRISICTAKNKKKSRTPLTPKLSPESRGWRWTVWGLSPNV